MKRLFTKKLMLLAAMLLAGMGSANAFEYGGLTYRVIDNVAKTVRVTYQGSTYTENPYTQASIKIDATVPLNGENYQVVEIGEYAFYGASLSSIDIDPSVKTVSNEAFGSCNNLTSIDLSNVENFGGYIFVGCKNLTTATLPTTLTSIPDGMFSGCSSMTYFKFPENVSIGSSAFKGTGLTSVPTSYSEIGYQAFYDCQNLTSVNINSCDNIGSQAFSNCQNLTSVTINSCSWIGSGAFSNCQNLTSIDIHTSEGVGNDAFSNDNNLKDVKLMGDIYLQAGAFSGCNNIKSIICFLHNVSDVGFPDDVKENAVVIVPESCTDMWSSFLNVQVADINNVGGHVVDVDVQGNFELIISINGKKVDPLYGSAFLFAPGSNVDVTFSSNWNYGLDKLFLNGIDMTNSVEDNKYTIKKISGNQTITATWKKINPTNITAVISSVGVATLYSEYPLDFSSVTGLKAYIVSAFTPVNNHSVLTPVTNVPAYTGVVLIGDEGSYTIPTTETQTYVANLLKGVLDDTWMTSYQNGCTNYVLANGSGGVGFYRVKEGGSILSAGKAYLAIPTNSPSAAPSFISLDLDGMDLTGINGIENSAADMNSKTIYNLNGQRQNGLKKGINIVGGKKIVVK